jgi:hypothetical protein
VQAVDPCAQASEARSLGREALLFWLDEKVGGGQSDIPNNAGLPGIAWEAFGFGMYKAVYVSGEMDERRVSDGLGRSRGRLRGRVYGPAKRCSGLPPLARH